MSTSSLGEGLLDAHVHVDLMGNPAQVAERAAELGLSLIDVTVTPQGYQSASRELAAFGNVHVAAGLHPWWVADGRATNKDVALAAELARTASIVGEIGLDASPKHVPQGSWNAQVMGLRSVLGAVADGASKGEKVLSLHSVRSATAVLDLLEELGLTSSCRCVFHWFTGTGEELHRAVLAGCWFSFGEMSLRTRRGREYARQVPVQRLLLETDLPAEFGVPGSADQIAASLERALATISDLRGHDLHAQVSQNGMALLDGLPRN